ncbi:T9SS type A sorting domain-containing protein [Chryseobacterium sp. B21-037]|uniref:T9SS type A sorting domain-containing protein n=1 Tax=unclassified Chryseobacterium TaxID=2593645 RepID=UPI00235836CE|nr:MULTISPECIES: T9SS type A sorting domain-containing protein [unclassified Chryseobacterium]MDC8104535.1 T9SS type A sorting domain-containing protein [Chryseobacterium sp. B21-037]MDQ1804143.1 T9SS type A sorting domain-containing protein [Chryseobacterium sp. CKR4-1]
MKKLYFSVLSMCIISGLSAQEVVWQKDIKSSTQDFLSQVTTTIDQQYLITGSVIQSGNQKKDTGSNTQQNNGYDFHLVKLNQQGDQVWEKYFSGNNHDYLSSTVATQEGGFLISGTSYSGKGIDKKDDSKGGSDIWLIRINEFGDELWQKTLGTSADEEARAVIQTTDLGFVVAGNVQNASKGYGSKDILVIRLDKNGKELSQLILGGRGLDEVEKMIPTRDGGALLGIYSRSSEFRVSDSGNQNSATGTSDSVSRYAKNTENFGEGDYWIIKLNKEGKVEWEKNLGGKGDDHLRTLALTSNGYIIGGESRSERSGNKTVGIEEGTDLWLVSLNERGDEQWQKSYNFKNRDVLMGMSVIQSQESRARNQEATKGILLGGYTQAEGKIDRDDETFWMLYLDHNGNEQWRKHVRGESRKREERLSDIKLNRDGSIILAGTSAEELGKENWKIVKLGDKQLDQLIEKQDIKIYPNPVSDYAYVEIGFDFREADITLYDMGGRQLQNLKTKNKVTKINAQPLIQGAYLVVIKTDTNKTANAKLIKK